MNDEITKLAQTFLKEKGFYTGKIDGDFGKMSRAAHSSYKRSISKTPKPSSMAESVAALAEKEVGVRESPMNSNKGKRVQQYQSATWLEGTGWAWCAAFICWLCKEAGMTAGRPRTAGAWDFERWAKKKNTPATLYKPSSKVKIRRGDIVVFYASHIGLAVSNESGGYVKTIEGNTDASGSREGGGVYRKTRSKRKIRSVIRLK